MATNKNTIEFMRLALVETMDLLRDELVKELRAQGHRLTGALEESLAVEYRIEPGRILAAMVAADYGVFVEFGVPAGRIPFGGRRTGGGGTSKYIQGLVRFFELKGLDQREALRAAFATARVHAREGMPSRGSHAFSSTGDRTAFVRTTLERHLGKVAAILGDRVGRGVQLDIAPDLDLKLEPIIFKI